jgi:hypothetical protein
MTETGTPKRMKRLCTHKYGNNTTSRALHCESTPAHSLKNRATFGRCDRRRGSQHGRDLVDPALALFRRVGHEREVLARRVQCELFRVAGSDLHGKHALDGFLRALLVALRPLDESGRVKRDEARMRPAEPRRLFKVAAQIDVLRQGVRLVQRVREFSSTRAHQFQCARIRLHRPVSNV